LEKEEEEEEEEEKLERGKGDAVSTARTST
jgi:hypothetical protein